MLSPSASWLPQDTMDRGKKMDWEGPRVGKGKENIDSCLPHVCILICPFLEDSLIAQHPPIDSTNAIEMRVR